MGYVQRFSKINEIKICLKTLGNIFVYSMRVQIIYFFERKMFYIYSVDPSNNYNVSLLYIELAIWRCDSSADNMIMFS